MRIERQKSTSHRLTEREREADIGELNVGMKPNNADGMNAFISQIVFFSRSLRVSMFVCRNWALGKTKCDNNGNER